MQGCAGQVRDRGLKGIKTVIQRQKGMLAPPEAAQEEIGAARADLGIAIETGAV
jgi:hypothetical protein